jgi:hypothetical protein
MTELFAQPYDTTAEGFYFRTPDQYEETAAGIRNDFGFPVEEFEIQFIDGEEIDAALFKALGVHQGNFQRFLAACETCLGEGGPRSYFLSSDAQLLTTTIGEDVPCSVCLDGHTPCCFRGSL